MVRDLGSTHEIRGSNLIATDVPKKKKKRKEIPYFTSYLSGTEQALIERFGQLQLIGLSWVQEHPLTPIGPDQYTNFLLKKYKIMFHNINYTDLQRSDRNKNVNGTTVPKWE